MSLFTKKHRIFTKYVVFSSFILTVFAMGNIMNSFAEEFTNSIPFGAYNPQLDTPTEVWYSPPVMYVKVGDMITWSNDDKEGHTVTSGQSAGRFGWMSQKEGGFGKADGIFDSGRFMPNESWSYTFDNVGTFNYFCIIHPWMEGIVVVEQKIPDYPHDYLGNEIEFPIDASTADGSVIVGLTWDPPIIKTFEKTQFIYHFHDAGSKDRLLNQKYDIVLIQNGKEIFSEGGVTGAGGDYRNFIFKESGDVIIRFKNIMSGGASGGATTGDVINLSVLQAEFSAIVYDNAEKTSTDEIIVQPARRIAFQYELAVTIMIVPATLFIIGIWWMMKKPKTPPPSSSSSNATRKL